MRLIDIDVEEVSLVDQPAIVEKFLVVKRLEPKTEDVMTTEQVEALTKGLREIRDSLAG